eukprot:UN02780
MDNNIIIYAQCFNTTHDNPYNIYDENTDQKWQDIVNKMYSMGVCGAWSSTASVLTTNTMLSISGFASNGITSGSLAASIQSYFGNVAAGSIFSSIQSLGAIGGVSMFGSMAIGTFIAWSVICGDFIDISINFMNENATQCFINEKVLYISLEQSQEIIKWFKQKKTTINLKDRLIDIIYDTEKKTNDILSWISDTTKEIEKKYEIKKTIQDQTTETLSNV